MEARRADLLLRVHRVRASLRHRAEVHRLVADRLPGVLRPAAQAFLVGGNRVQGQRLLPHGQSRQQLGRLRINPGWIEPVRIERVQLERQIRAQFQRQVQARFPRQVQAVHLRLTVRVGLSIVLIKPSNLRLTSPGLLPDIARELSTPRWLSTAPGGPPAASARSCLASRS